MGTRFVLLLGLGVAATAQTLEVTPATMDRGSANILRITFKPRAEKAITALQWDLVFRQGLRIVPDGVVCGSAAESAGKSLACGRKPSDGGNQRLTCILAGGVQPLREGVIAIIRLEAAGDARKGKTAVDLEKVQGVSPALDSVPMEGTTAPVTIR